MKVILVFNLIGSLIHQSEAYKPVVVIHGLKEKVSDLDFLKDNITKVIKMTITRLAQSGALEMLVTSGCRSRYVGQFRYW